MKVRTQRRSRGSLAVSLQGVLRPTGALPRATLIRRAYAAANNVPLAHRRRTLRCDPPPFKKKRHLILDCRELKVPHRSANHWMTKRKIYQIGFGDTLDFIYAHKCIDLLIVWSYARSMAAVRRLRICTRSWPQRKRAIQYYLGGINRSRSAPCKVQ